MNQFFYSYYAMKGGVKVGYGHGTITCSDEDIGTNLKTLVNNHDGADDVHVISLSILAKNIDEQTNH